MSIQKPSIPKGTRDFGPAVVARRNYIFGIIRRTFEKFGYAPLETPTLENLSVLTGKYGDEGDQLLFKVLNSGDFLKDVTADDLQNDDGRATRRVLPKLAEKGLRYDLTVPFARYVVMNRGTLVFPFKRYQIQPVWRADRPQRGRYREFYQCDADVVGTDSLLCEAEIVLMMCEVLDTLNKEAKSEDQKLKYTIKINHRDALRGIFFAAAENRSKESDFFVVLDKLDKIGTEGVKQELKERGFSNNGFQWLTYLLRTDDGNRKMTSEERMIYVNAMFKEIMSDPNAEPVGSKGIKQLQEVFNILRGFDFKQFQNLEFDPTLARGLSYYTGCIFEIKINNVNMGSVSGGGRYDNLTGAFGLPGVSGVGFSFGVDRLYDCLEELNLFPEGAAATTRCLIANFDAAAMTAMLPVLRDLRAAGIASELYPEPAKLAKQFKYADGKGIAYVLLQGPEELALNTFKLKDLRTGQEQTLTLPEVVATLG
ncbi:histidyl-tRNA synthetase [Hymenobacter daecheongensis DSM 21074]|uniref:Histidine--tRNA ligase n=1 Tax=Hymenobacter daecheongensis DSM 21074 TaxID=1121955 RepID=A0A1M6EEN5_9BACT|nr:histidine--tRNA ligase [Hymenobacter daecheongensis]SHI83946.1 histidyl-tRNA synthetase [Hymenobacter daecheongensis DSM 21074]